MATMRKPENEKYVKLGLTGISVIVISLLCFFVLFRLREFSNGFQKILTILAPFSYGAVLAYLLAPACNRIENILKRILPRPKGERLAGKLAILISLVLTMVVLWVLIMTVLPQVGQSILDIVQALPGQLETAIAWVNSQLNNRPEWQTQLNSILMELERKIQDWMQTDLIPTVQNLLNSLGGKIAGLITLVKNLFLGLMVSIYLLGSRKKFAAQAKLFLHGVFPNTWADWICAEAHYADQMFSGFLMGKLLDSLIIGILCFIVTFLMRFPSALLISVIVGVTNIIPFFGPFIGAIPCVLLLLLENPLHSLYFIIFIVILQQFDGNILGPKILGDSTGLSGLWVLFAILLFGGLWGFIGMLVGVPLFAVIYDIIRQSILYGLKRHGASKMLTEYQRKFPE